MKKILLTHLNPLILLGLTAGTYFTFIFQNIILLSQKGLFFGHEYAWSDWPLHIAIANIFALKDPSSWFSYHPLYAQGKFTYPFLADLISGILMRLGISLTTSFILPSIITVFLFIIFSYFLIYLLFKSKKIAVISIFIFLLSSGPGFLNFITDYIKTPTIETLLFPPFEYSKALIYNWGSGNVATGLLVPQRAFLLGITMGIFVLLALTLFLDNKIKDRRNSRLFLIFAGIVAGILPITHPHSFIAVTIITGTICLLNFRKIRELSFFFVPATVFSFVLYTIFVHGGIESKSFISFTPGWTANGVLDFLAMWWILWGLTIPTAAVSLYILYRRSAKTILIFFSGFILLFTISNIFQFQPTAWDNSKLFFWVYFGFSILCAFFVVELSKKGVPLKVFAVILFIFLTLTGLLELTRLARVDKHTYLSMSKEDMELADRIRQSTDLQDRFLTGTTHDSLVMVWAGRPILMGYAGWVQNFGFNYKQTEQDIINIYQGQNAKNLLRKYKIKYVLIGPWEKQNYNPNTNYFIDNFPLFLSNNRNQIFKIN